MNNKKNEQGYALVMVLMLVFVFSILGMGLFALNMNASKQFNHKEETIQARHYAEMGVLHYKAELESFVKTNSKNENLSCSDFPKKVNQSSGQGYNDYEVTMSCIDEGEDVKKIIIGSLGKVEETDEKIEAIFKVNQTNPIKKEEGSIPTPADYNDSVKIIEGSYNFANGIYTQTKDSLHIKGRMTVAPGNSNGGNEITIRRNLFIDQDMHLQNHACVVTQGDLIVKGNITSTNKVYIFVYGDAYFNHYTYTSSNNEIFVSGKVYENGVEKTNTYPSVPQGTSYNYGNGNGNDKKSCPLPGSGNPGIPSYSWQLEDKLEVDYFK